MRPSSLVATIPDLFNIEDLEDVYSQCSGTVQHFNVIPLLHIHFLVPIYTTYGSSNVWSCRDIVYDTASKMSSVYNQEGHESE